MRDLRATAERMELGAMVESLGRWAEAKSGTQRLEAETRDPLATTSMETEVGSDLCSALRGDGGLGSRSGCVLDRG